MDINPDHCTVTQGFGGHGNASYTAQGLMGHPGVDTEGLYGSLIRSPVEMAVYKILTKENPAHDGSGFTGVFGIVDDGIECYEYLIGHCDPIVSVGQVVKMGDLIAREANHGPVYFKGIPITLAMQAAGDQRGHHRHNQKRPVMKVQHTQPQFSYLSVYSDGPAGAIYRDLQGYYYQIWSHNNGFNGCIDPTKSVFERDLTIGATGYDVFVLQNILVREGVATFTPTGYFGNLTAAALKKLQDKVGIMPDVGYFGPKTRTILQAKYNV